MSTGARWLTSAARGTLVNGDPDAVATGRVCVDTRRLERGDVFIALPGAHVHGRDYVEEALDRGADGVIAARSDLGPAKAAKLAIAVADPLRSLWGIAHARRREFTGPVVAVTGSSGKTSTTSMLDSLLGTTMPTHVTWHGFNTHQGVAATIAGLDEQDRALVVEVSMQGPRHIADKTALLQPTAGLITNIGPVHLSTAGSLVGIAANKAELIAGLPPQAPCVIPAAEPLLEPHRRPDLRFITHGAGGDVSLVDCRDRLARIDCKGTTVIVQTPFTQSHNLSNLVAAVALLHALAVPIPSGLKGGLSPLRWERALLGEAEVVLDCFNNSPMALEAALTAFAAEPAARRLAVLGEFTELGAAATSHHRRAGKQVQELGIDMLIVVGGAAREYLLAYRGPHHCVDSPLEARRLLIELTRPGDRVLVKGPRAARLEQVISG
jgi:UDP-N-acetylmuramoyl-tripeptide--D-alanyl-D-alanine ligase